MKCHDCNARKGVKLCQGDLMLCASCNAKRSTSTSTESESEKDKMATSMSIGMSPADQLHAMLQPISAQLLKIGNDLMEVKKKQADLVSSFDFFNEKYEALSARLDQVFQCNKELKQVNKDLSQRVTALEREVTDLNQYQRRINLEISGVPVSENEDTTAIVLSVCKKVNPGIQASDIDIAHRLPTKENNSENEHTKPRPIIVKFTTRSSRNSIYENRKNLKDITARNFGFNSTGRIFINENLVLATRQLLFKVNIARKRAGYRFLWTNNGKIYIKKNVNSR
ncbi:uncharacterized protein LOC144358550, partial [Saccoglossus kowalevskii]